MGNGSSLRMARRGHSTTSTWPVCSSGPLIWKHSVPRGLSGGPSGRAALLSAMISSPSCYCVNCQGLKTPHRRQRDSMMSVLSSCTYIRNMHQKSPIMCNLQPC